MRDKKCEMRDKKCEIRDKNARCEIKNARCEIKKCEMRDVKIGKDEPAILLATMNLVPRAFSAFKMAWTNTKKKKRKKKKTEESKQRVSYKPEPIKDYLPVSYQVCQRKSLLLFPLVLGSEELLSAAASPSSFIV